MRNKPFPARIAFVRFVGCALAVVLVGAAAGCGDDDLSVGGSLPPVPTVTEATPTPTPDCTEFGGFCVQGIDCCSGLCLFNQCQ